MRSLYGQFFEDEAGATAIEYGLIALFIAVAIISTLTTIGTELQVPFQNVSNGLKVGNAK